jgi:uncharacterized membrane-anchored protein YjiN (DUF445 family)
MPMPAAHDDDAVAVAAAAAAVVESSARASREAAKARELRRMQRLATGLLAGLLALLVACAVLEPRVPALAPWLEWVRAFAEAGAIGAMADWYAVVALFRHPLGLPIPHTAIIQKRKDALGASIGQFVEEYFLTPDNIIRKLEEHNAGRAVAEWLADPLNSRAVADSLTDVVPAVLDALQDDDLAAFFDRTVTPQLLRLDAARLAGDILDLLTARDRHQPLLDRAAHAVEGWLAVNQDFIVDKFGAASRYTPAAIDKYIVAKITEGVIALLHDVAAHPQHELRLQFDEAVRTLIDNLRSSPEYREQGRALVRDFVEHLRTERYWRVLWADLRERLTADLRSERSVVKSQVAGGLEFLGRELLADAAVQAKLNAWWLRAVREIVIRYRHQISALITEVVRRWDVSDISRKVELEIGKDLQYIRINGSVVGGLVGLMLHGVTRVAGG